MYVDARETSGWPPYPGAWGGARSVGRKGRGQKGVWLTCGFAGRLSVGAMPSLLHRLLFSMRTERWGNSEGVIKSSFCPWELTTDSRVLCYLQSFLINNIFVGVGQGADGTLARSPKPGTTRLQEF